MKKNIAVFAVLVILFLGANACSKSSNAEGEKKIEETVSYPLEPIVVNIAGSGEMKYMKIQMSLELANNALAEKAKTKTPQLRDAIIAIATTKSPDDLSNPEGKVQFKNEILAKSNEILQKGSVKGIYFTDFVLQ